jgi:UDP-glucose 4-epimerase
MTAAPMRQIAVVGGAGFIGSHFVETLLMRAPTERVTVYDNFSSGQRWHLANVESDPRLTIATGDVRDLDRLSAAVAGHDTVIHLASNPDIAAAVTNPAIDFDHGTVLTHHVAEASRRGGVQLILYASGSGVYGDLGEVVAAEDHGPLVPVSTYGASKLAGEALLASYAFMFGIAARCFRFGNVVGPRQTHGVGYDFIRRLVADPTRLRILGDGRQSKSYVYVDDVVAAVLTAAERVAEPFAVFNVATLDYITVTEIAELAMEVLAIPTGSTTFEYTGGDRGWKGDVPVVRLDSDRMRALGWKNERSCREAVRDSLAAVVVDARRPESSA